MSGRRGKELLSRSRRGEDPMRRDSVRQKTKAPLIRDRVRKERGGAPE